MTGYQQAILYLSGSYCGDRFCVRNVDRWYVDQVADLFLTRPYLQRRSGEKRDYYVVKSCRWSRDVQLSDVVDVAGFCRGVVELQGTFALWCHRSHGEVKIKPRLRLYGTPELLSFVASAIPAAPKKMQAVHTNIGSTSALYYQSRAEIADIFAYLDGDPRNAPLWDRWYEQLRGERS